MWRKLMDQQSSWLDQIHSILCSSHHIKYHLPVQRRLLPFYDLPLWTQESRAHRATCGIQSFETKTEVDQKWGGEGSVGDLGDGCIIMRERSTHLKLNVAQMKETLFINFTKLSSLLTHIYIHWHVDDVFGAFKLETEVRNWSSSTFWGSSCPRLLSVYCGECNMLKSRQRQCILGGGLNDNFTMNIMHYYILYINTLYALYFPYCHVCLILLCTDF